MSFLPGNLISNGMASYHAFPFNQFISPMTERDVETSETANLSGPYKKLKTQNINGIISHQSRDEESLEEEEVESRTRRGYVSHAENEPVNLRNQHKNSRENIQPNQNVQLNDFYPGYGYYESQPMPFTFFSGFMTTVQPGQPSPVTLDSSSLQEQPESLENSQTPAISLSDLSAMKTDWFRMKYAESQDPMWAYLLEQQEDFLNFTNKITEIINVCSLPTENTVIGDLSQRHQRENTRRRETNSVSCNVLLGDDTEEQRRKKKTSKKVEKKKVSRKNEKPVKKQLRNNRDS